MLNMTNLLAPAKGAALYNLYFGLSVTMIILMCVTALVAIILVLLQPANSTGIDALGGSSETFFGKNKGKSMEAKMKKWTWICLAVILVLSVISYLIQSPILWN